MYQAQSTGIFPIAFVFVCSNRLMSCIDSLKQMNRHFLWAPLTEIHTKDCDFKELELQESSKSEVFGPKISTR